MVAPAVVSPSPLRRLLPVFLLVALVGAPWTPLSDAAQVGLHEAATGTTDAWLSLPNRELLSNSFDAGGNQDVQSFTQTETVAGDLRLTGSASTTTITSFMGQGTAVNVSARPGQGLEFPSLTGGLPVVAVAGTIGSTFAVGPDGFTYGWGDYVIGDNTPSGTAHASPTKVFTGDQRDASGYLRNIASIAAGSGHILAVDTSGNVWAWGQNSWGGLGLGNTTQQLVPRKVLTGSQGHPSGYLSGIVQVAAGYAGSSFALDSAGCVWSWGYNEFYHLGDGSNTPRTTPIKVLTLPQTQFCNVREIEVSAYGVIAIDRSNQVWYWGQIGGDGTNALRYYPTRVVTGAQNDPSGYLSNIQTIGASIYEVLAIGTNGKVWGWGQNGNGNLGIGNNTAVYRPYRVKTGDQGDASGFFVGAKAVGCTYANCFVANATRAFGMGPADTGILGNGEASAANYNTPKFVLTGQQNSASGKLENIAGFGRGWEAGAGAWFSIFVATDGTTYSAGKHLYGRLGLGNGGDASTKATPQKVVPGEQTGQGAQFKAVVTNGTGSSGAGTIAVAGQWKLEETSGDYLDTSVPGNHATLYGGVTRGVTGHIGKAARFDGTTGYLEVNNEPGLRPSTAMTMRAWFRSDVKDSWSDGHHIFRYGGMGMLRIKPGSNNLQASLTTTVTTYTAEVDASAWSIDTWHRLVATYDGANLRFSLDGVVKATTPATGVVNTPDTSLFIGSTHVGNGFWKGDLDELELDHTALTAQGVADDYSGSSGPLMTGSFTSNILDAHYDVTSYWDDRVIVGSATATVEWRSGWTLLPTSSTWTPWTMSVPSTRQYYQYRIQFAKPLGDETSNVTLRSFTYTTSQYAPVGSSTIQWTVPGGVAASEVTLTVSQTLAADSTTGYAVRPGSTGSYTPLVPGQRFVFPTPSTTVSLRVDLSRVWDTPRVHDVSLTWAAPGEQSHVGANERVTGSTSETNTASVTPSLSLGAAALVVPVSEDARGVVNVTAGAAVLTAASSLDALEVGLYYYDPASQVVYVGVTANAGVSITRRVSVTYGASFDVTVPTHLASGDYYIVSGTIRDAAGQPVDGVQAEVEFYQGGASRFGPVKKFVVSGNLELSVSTNFIAPGAYNVSLAFVDTSGVRFVESRPLTVSGGRQVVTVGSGFQAYANARVHFSFFDADTGFGLDPAFLRVLARDDGEPRPTDRLYGASFATTTGLTLRYRVEDYWGDRVYPVGSEASASLVVDAREMFVDVGLNLLDLKVKNTNSSVIHLHLSKGSATRSEYVLPQEIVSFALRAGTYQVALDYYDAATGAYQRTLQDNLTVATDLFYWIRGHDLGDIVIEIHNAESNLGQQVVEVNVNVENLNSTIGTQAVSTRTELHNVNSTIHLSLQLLRALLESSNSTISRLVHGLDANLTNRLLNQSGLLVDALGNVSVGEELLDALKAPHKIFVPAFNYTGMANDTLPPTSYVRVSQDLTDAGAAILRWGASDNALLLHVRLEYRPVGGEWAEVGTLAATSGEERVTGLDVGTVYEFRSQGRDAAGNMEPVATDDRQPNYATFEAGSGTSGVRFAPPDRKAFFIPGPGPAPVAMALAVIAVVLYRNRAASARFPMEPTTAMVRVP